MSKAKRDHWSIHLFSYGQVNRATRPLCSFSPSRLCQKVFASFSFPMYSICIKQQRQGQYSFRLEILIGHLAYTCDVPWVCNWSAGNLWSWVKKAFNWAVIGCHKYAFWFIPVKVSHWKKKKDKNVFRSPSSSSDAVHGTYQEMMSVGI